MTNKENNFAKDINVPSKEQINDSLKNLDKNFNEKFNNEKELIAIQCTNYTLETKSCSKSLSGSCCGEMCQTFNLIKQLARKTQIINEIEEIITPYQEPIELDALSLPGAIESILERQKQECDILKSQLDFTVQQKECFEQLCEALKSEGFTRESLITEQENEIDKLRQKCEELKEKLQELELKNMTLQNRNQQLDGAITECDCYRKALKKIEKYCIDQNLKYDYTACEILDIINKTKGT